MDVVVFRFLNGFAGQSAFWDGVIVFIASYLQYALGALLIACSLWPVRRFPMFAASFSAAIIARLGVKPLMLLFVHRARPFVSLDSVHDIVGTDAGEQLQSFPSGHAIFFFALAMAAYRYDKRWGAVFFAGALLMGIARVIGGVHWPSDILGGALIGTLVGWLTVQLVLQFRRALPVQK
ncbi:MAG: phosphatase PAP2 family protein [Patescibacteria group bacterium]